MLKNDWISVSYMYIGLKNIELKLYDLYNNYCDSFQLDFSLENTRETINIFKSLVTKLQQ